MPTLTGIMHDRAGHLSTAELLQAVALVITIIFVYTIATMIYNVFFHPLRKFPGPILARATNLSWSIESSKGRSVSWMHQLHEKYGPVVRYGPDKLSSIKPETWKEVYGHHVPQWPKDPNFFGRDPYGDPPGLLRADDNSHARQRKLVSHAFSDKALREQEHIVKHYVSLLVEKLRQDATDHDGKVDLVSWFNFTTFDVMADLTFGESLNQLAGSMYSPWVKSIFSHVRSIQLVSIASEWQPFTKLLTWLFMSSKIKKERQDVYRFAADKVKDRLNKKVERNDIWSYILRYSDDGGNEVKREKGLVFNEMLSNGQTFMAAGTETTATLLSGLFYYLLRDNQRHVRLVNEIRDAFATYEEMTMSRLAEQKYLQACIEEALRIYPPVAVGISRMAPKDGAKLGTDFVPKGTRVQLSQFAAYHSPQNFKDPDSFIPERWLPEGLVVYGSDKRDVVQPFSYGPRNCLGKNLAYHEMRFIAASLLWHFDLELAPEIYNWADQPVYNFWVKKPLVVFLRPARG